MNLYHKLRWNDMLLRGAINMDAVTVALVLLGSGCIGFLFAPLGLGGGLLFAPLLHYGLGWDIDGALLIVSLGLSFKKPSNQWTTRTCIDPSSWRSCFRRPLIIRFGNRCWSNLRSCFEGVRWIGIKEGNWNQSAHHDGCSSNLHSNTFCST